MQMQTTLKVDVILKQLDFLHAFNKVKPFFSPLIKTEIFPEENAACEEAQCLLAS